MTQSFRAARPRGPGAPGLSFTVETGRDLLGSAFANVTLHEHEVPLAIPDPAGAVIRAGGAFRVTARSGVFACR